MNIYEYLRLKGNIPQAPGLGITGIQLPQAAAGPAMVGRGGPLAAQAPAPPRGRGFLGAIDDVFGGPDMANLTPEQRKAARRRGLLAFGAQMLTATDPRGNRAQGLSALGQGIMAAQGGYGQGIEQGMAANQAQQRQALYGAFAPRPNESTAQRYDRILGMFNAAFQQGDVESMKFISQALNTMPKPGDEKGMEPKPPQAHIGPDGVEYTWAPPDATHPEWWQKPTGRRKPADVKAPDKPRAAPRMTGTQAKAQSFRAAVDSDIANIERTLQAIDPSSKWRAATGPGALGQVIRAGDPNAQMLEGAAGTLAEAWLRITTGAAYNETEYQNARNRFLILPTDTKQAIEWKKNNMKLLQGALADLAGTPTAPDANELADLLDMDVAASGR